MMNAKTVSKLGVIIVCAVSFVLLPSTSHAYYDDVHYALTYYLARAAGYTPMQAHRIASADVMTDYDFHTEPVQAAAQAAWVGGATVNKIVPGSSVAAYPTKEAARWQAQIPRIDFHAFMDCYNYADCLSNPAATAVIPQKRAALEQAAQESGNPGSLLHFVQDEVPHSGYPSDNGHWTAVDATAWNWAELPLGATTDYLSYPGHGGLQGVQGPMMRNRPCVERTLEILKNFMEGNFNGKSIHQKPRNYNWSGEIVPAFQATINANPDPSPSLMQAIEKAKGDLTDFYDHWKGDSAPKLEPAIAALNGVLANSLKAKDQIPSAWLTYDLNRQGVPEPADRSTWILWGNLKINIKIMKQGEEIGRTTKDITLKVIQAPTFENKEDEVIEKKIFRDSDPISLVNVPVGELIVELTYDTRKPDRRNVRIEGPEQEVTLTLDLDKEDEQTASLEELLKLRDRMKELEKKSNEYANEASKELTELEKYIREADTLVGSAIDGYTALAQKVETWSTQIAELEAAIQKQQGYLTEVQTGKQKALDAETAAREKDCPPANVIEEGTEEERQAAIENAKTNVQSIGADVQNAEAGAMQAKTAAEELTRLRSLSEKLSAEIKSADVATLTGSVASATSALDGAQTHIDRLTDLAANLESVKNEADELMKLVQAEVKKLESAENVKDRVKEITAEIDASYKTILSNYEKWKDVRLAQTKKSDDLRAQITEMDGKIQALAGKIGALVVPTFDAGSAGADAETADSTLQSVKTIAGRVKDCPETLAGIELKETDRIVSLDILIEQTSPERFDGTAEYHISADVTAEIKDRAMILCEGSHIPGYETGSAAGVEFFGPDTHRIIPLGRADFKMGDEVTVSCYIKDPHKKVSVTKRIGADGAAGKLLEEIKSLVGRAKSIKDSAGQVSDSARDKAKDLNKELDRSLGDASDLDGEASEYLSSAHALPSKKDQAASHSTAADAAAASGNAAAALIQQSAQEVCGILDAVKATDIVSELQNHLANAQSKSATVQEKEQEFNSALAQAQNESQSAGQILSEVKKVSSEKGSKVQSGLASLTSSLESSKSKASSLEDQLKLLAGKKPEMSEVKSKAQTIAGQADQMKALEISKEDRKAVKEIRKAFEKIEGYEEDVLQSESKALEKSSGVEPSISDLEARISEIKRKASEADGLLAAGGDVSIIEEFTGRSKSAAESLSVQAQTVSSQSSQCAGCLSSIEAIVAEKTSPEAQVARHDCSQSPNTQAMWNAAAQAPECACIDGYEPDPGGAGCRITVAAAIAQKDCSTIPGSRALWNEATREAYCGCIQGFKWNETQTACIADIAAQMAAIDCSRFPGAVKAWNPTTQKAICDCAAAGLEWNNSGTACRASAQAQVAGANCSNFPGSVPVWEGAAERVMCQCPGGSELSMDGNSCVPYGQGQSRANQPPPNNPSFNPNALTGLMDTWNTGANGGNPPPNTGSDWGGGNMWNPSAYGNSNSNGIPPGGMLPGFGPTGGSGSNSGGQPVGFTGFGGTDNTGGGWTNTGYSPPPPPPSGGYTGGVSTTPGGSGDGENCEDGRVVILGNRTGISC